MVFSFTYSKMFIIAGSALSSKSATLMVLFKLTLTASPNLANQFTSPRVRALYWERQSWERTYFAVRSQLDNLNSHPTNPLPSSLSIPSSTATTTLHSPMPMFMNSEVKILGGTPTFTEVNGVYHRHNHAVSVSNTNSNNTMGNAFTNTNTDNSQTYSKLLCRWYDLMLKFILKLEPRGLSVRSRPRGSRKGDVLVSLDCMYHQNILTWHWKIICLEMPKRQLQSQCSTMHPRLRRPSLHRRRFHLPSTLFLIRPLPSRHRTLMQGHLPMLLQLEMRTVPGMDILRLPC